ncbi:LysR family transcriptional regulator [Marinomonas sp. M1K-6]|uniref:LysR family transcriptional regulator n=1 Tax=Marinomonas profundi TaxID=2726122 RepID=A0A847QZQ8_9GAMM|nr:LysR family transcriptional regulator [Marinomonas profundi]NLQ16465.1 LysR family transcriptional regulator [Marinomonas profundi]UDV03945.1 LysR family transcriptional regulator [Marinomonas profundi]
MYDLNEVKTFVSVMETGSLKISAQKLGVSKSTLSRRISHLESALNQPLLRRQANRLIANEAGIKFLPFAERMLKTATEGQKAVEELKEEVSGELTLYVHDTLVRGWFSGLMFSFLDLYPSINMEVKTGNGFPQALVENDVSIWVGEPKESALRTEKIGSLSNSVYASPGYLEKVGPLHHPSELNRCAWVDLLKNEKEEVHLHHPHEGSMSFRLPQSRLVVDQHTLQSDAVVRDKGIGILSNFLVDKRLEHHPGCLVKCLDEWQAEPLAVYLQYPFGHLPKKLRALIDYLKAEGQQFY